MFRIYLGKKLVETNLLTNGDFSSGSTGWTTTGTWTFTSNRANIGGSGIGNTLEAKGVLTPGETYVLDYDISDAGAVAFLGDWQHLNFEPGFPQTVYSGTNLLFVVDAVVGGGTPWIDNVVLYKYEWNEALPLTEEPQGLANASIVRERNVELSGWFDEFIQDLVFYGQAYRYLKRQNAANPHGVVDCRIEIEVNGNWYHFFEGEITLAELQWDYTKCQVTAHIEAVSTRALENGKDTLYRELTDTPDIIELPSATFSIDFHDASSNYTHTNKECYDVYTLLERLVWQVTGGKIAFQSDFFTSGIGANYVLTLGRNIAYYLPDGYEAEAGAEFISFKGLFEELNKFFNLQIFIERQGVLNVLRIESKTEGFTNDPVIVLDKEAGGKGPVLESIAVRTEGNPHSFRIGHSHGASGSDIITVYSFAPGASGTQDIITDYRTNNTLILALLGEHLIDENILDNNSFTVPDGWNISAGWAYSTVNDRFSFSSASEGRLWRDDVFEVGVKYEITIVISTLSAGTITVLAGATQGAARTMAGTYTESLTVTSSKTLAVVASAGGNAAIDSITIKKYGYLELDENILDAVILVRTNGSDETNIPYGGAVEPEDMKNRFLATLPSGQYSESSGVSGTDNSTVIGSRLATVRCPVTYSQWKRITGYLSTVRVAPHHPDFDTADGLVQRMETALKGGQTVWEVII